MRGVLFLLFLLWATSLWADQVCRLKPAQLAPGGVSRLICAQAQLEQGTVTYKGQTLPLRRSAAGLETLLGVDLDQQAGIYPLQVDCRGKDGRRIEGLALQVKAAARQDEHLSLPQRFVAPQKAERLQRIKRERQRLQRLYGRHSLWRVSDWRLPVTDPLSSPFGRGRVLNGQRRSAHSGQDFRSPAGRQVRASGAGEVVLVDRLYYTGLTVVIDHGQGLVGIYAHLSAADCHVGELLQAGDPIGRVGQSGRATGPHLHWSLRLHRDRVDPMAVSRLLDREQVDRP